MSPYIYIFIFIIFLILIYLYVSSNNKTKNTLKYSNSESNSEYVNCPNADLTGNKKYPITQTYVDYGNINKCNECETSLFNSSP
jgi:hypothetical protein